jgi:hypothetical protein
MERTMNELPDMFFPEDTVLTLEYEMAVDLEDELMGDELPCPFLAAGVVDPADVDIIVEEA